ncbi:MAG: Fic family protein [Candidatus Woesearchaeota archaeon]
MKKPTPPPDPKKILDQNKELLWKYVRDQEIKDFIDKANQKYWYWDELKRRQKPKEITYEELWAITRTLREVNSKEISIGKPRQFTYTVTDEMLKDLHILDMNLGGSLKEQKSADKEKKEKYLASSRMEEAIASSQIEGAVTTRKIAKKMLLQKRIPRNNSEKMILNNYNTVKELNELAEEELTEELIKYIHSSITKETLESNEYEGSFRKTDDVIVYDKNTNEVLHMPPKHKEISKFISEICAFANHDEETFLHPIIKASILHFMIGYVHPFVDGNGRTARAIFYWFLLRKDYWLVEYTSISRLIVKAKAQYMRAYLHTEKDQNDLTYFIQHNMKQLNNAVMQFNKYLEEKKKEKDQMSKQISTEQLNQRQIQILVDLDKDEEYTYQSVAEQFRVTIPTARSDLLELEKKGHLHKNKRGRTFIFTKK